MVIVLSVGLAVAFGLDDRHRGTTGAFSNTLMRCVDGSQSVVAMIRTEHRLLVCGATGLVAPLELPMPWIPATLVKLVLVLLAAAVAPLLAVVVLPRIDGRTLPAAMTTTSASTPASTPASIAALTPTTTPARPRRRRAGNTR